MPIGMEWLVWEPVVVHDLSTHESFEWQCREHVQAEEETSNIHHEVVVRKVVKHIAQGLVAECEVAGQSHDEARDQRDTRAVVCNTREAVDGWLAEGAINEKAVVMADESEGYNAYSLENAGVDDERAT